MKRFVAFLCALALVVCLIPGGSATVALAAEGGDSYKVGYSKKDVTPYIKNAYTGDLGIENREYADAATYVGTVQIHNPNNTSEIVEIPFVKTPLSGYGAITTRLAGKMTDDNGDGLIGLGDGIFVTATVVLIMAFNSPPDFLQIISRSPSNNQRFAKIIRYKKVECLPNVSNISATGLVS